MSAGDLDELEYVVSQRQLRASQAALRRAEARIARLEAAIQEVGTLLDFEAHLGDQGHARVLHHAIRQLTEALEARAALAPEQA